MAAGRRALWCVGLLLWCWVVYLLSVESDPTEVVDWALAVPDWLAHGCVYAVGGFLAFGTFASSRRLRGVGLAVGFVLLRGLLDEWHQSFVPGRSPEASDVLADVVGGAAGTLVHLLWSARVAGTGSGAGPVGDTT